MNRIAYMEARARDLGLTYGQYIALCENGGLPEPEPDAKTRLPGRCCLLCGRRIRHPAPTQKYCGAKCRHRYYYLKNTENR